MPPCKPITEPLRCASRFCGSLRLLGVFLFVQTALIAAFVWNVPTIPGFRVALPPAVWPREQERSVLRVGLCPQADGFSSPFGPGFDQELLERFARERGLTLRWRFPDSETEGLRLIESGDVDLLAGYAGPTPKGLEGGPAYALARPSARLEALLADAGTERLLRRGIGTPLASLRADAVSPSETPFKVPAPAIASDGLTESAVLPQVTPLPSPPASGRWLWREDSFLSPGEVAAFWDGIKRSGTLDRLHDTYFGFMDEDASPNLRVLDMTAILGRNLRRHADAIRSASRRYGIDPLLVAALIYHESRFDPEARSPTGPTGLMQLSLSTARFLNVDPLDAAASIDAGTRYLRLLWEGIDDPGIAPWDRWFFALAAYNQGPGNLRAAMRLSRERGGTGTTWRELKAVFPLLSPDSGAIGDCRGNEAVAYVERIRYTYYLLYGALLAGHPASPVPGASDGA